MDTQTAALNVAEFVRDHGRWPAACAPTANTTEASLARRMEALRRRRLDKRTAAFLTEQVPGWKNRALVRWHQSAQDTASHRAITGSWPSQSSYDPAESRLGSWLSEQRVIAADRDRLGRIHTPAQEAFLHAVAPGWQHTVDFEHTFRSRVGLVVEFVDEHGRFPSIPSSSPQEEYLARMLAGWRSAAAGRNGRHAAKFTNSRIGYLDRRLPGWNHIPPAKGPQTPVTLRPGQWQDTAEEAERFVRRHRGVYPSRKAMDPAERRLGWWVYEQRYAMDKAYYTSTPDRRTWLDAHLPSWRDYMRRGAPGRPVVTTDR